MDTATPTKDSEALASMVIQSTAGLPAELQVAQGAIGLPEVQAMLRRLADFNLGIYMPHLHEDETGRFLPLPDGLIQVEDDLTVTFQTEQQLARQRDPVIQVGWLWRGDGVHATAKCVSYCKKTGSAHDTMHRIGSGDSDDDGPDPA